MRQSNGSAGLAGRLCAGAAIFATVLIALPAASRAEDMHPTVIPQASWGNLPQWIPMDTGLEKCEARGGTQTGRQGFKICSIKTEECETHAGWKVVERDAYKQGSARIAACT
jgi:hypothetical protein